MPRVKVDNRIRVQIENGVAQRHRSFFVVLGEKGRDAVVILHHMLSKAAVAARPSVLWCYKKELGFSSHRKKRMKQLQKKIRSGNVDMNKDDPFELFISATNIRYCYYNETQKILGNTYGMCVLQDFEALTPNLLARTMETVEGGGIVVLLLRTLTSLRQLKTMVMDVHSRYRTSAHQDVVARFNERFLLSLADCTSCMLISDELKVLPLSSHSANVKPLPPKESGPTDKDVSLCELKKELEDEQPYGAIVNCCKTVDQGKALLTFIQAICQKTLRSIVALTAARGRGKSACLGLAIAAAVGFDYSNIFVVSPSPENLKTLFEFIFKGLDAMHFQEHVDYEIIQSTNPEFNKCVVRVNIFKGHRQTISYIHPSDASQINQAELVAIDEAAAIPLPLVKKLLGRHLVFMASTINGYEGTGRSLSLKLIKELRVAGSPMGFSTASSRTFREITLEEPIRYGENDPVEDWLHRLLCLNVSSIQSVSKAVYPPECELYYVNRDTLMCYHKVSEAFLQQLMSLYVSSHYKNTPNDLQLLSDAPAHHLFVLLPPHTPGVLPEILAVVQVCLEGQIAKESIAASLARGQRSAGDLIPWTVSQQFNESDFGRLSGARVVRIATHPDHQKKGYGTRALEQLKQYYSGDIACMGEPSDAPMTAPTVDDSSIDDQVEVMKPRSNLPPLLWKLSERPPEKLDYIGTSYGMTGQLYRFWWKNGYSPVYLRQTANDLTGEHTCIMLNVLHKEFSGSWLESFNEDFRHRFVYLLGGQFSSFPPATALSIMVDRKDTHPVKPLTVDEVSFWFTPYDIDRLDKYSNNLVDYHLVVDLVPKVAQLYFLRRLDIKLYAAQSAILLGLGLQFKTVEKISEDIELPVGQVLGLFNRIIRKVVKVLIEIKSAAIEKTLPLPARVVALEPTAQTMDEALTEAAEEVSEEQKKELEKLKAMDLSQFAIAGSDEAWDEALSSKSKSGNVTIKSVKKRKAEDIPEEPDTQRRKKKQHRRSR
eukprot:scpid27031/ scgid9589/ N-acetyltransferase 10